MQDLATGTVRLGATCDGCGVSFALFSEHAEGVEVCLFDEPTGQVERTRTALERDADGIWRAHMPGLRAGQLYGYRVRGVYDPAAGLRFNDRKLLIDPYGRAVAGRIIWDDGVYGYAYGAASDAVEPDRRDSAAFVPKSVVVSSTFDWGDDRPPRTPWERTVIYECHVKGMTQTHPEVPENLRGTYLGLASRPVIDHLLRLGVTAVELMPVHHSLSRRRLVEQGLSNYWGYDPIAFFAADARFATGDRGEQVDEFKSMVGALHAAGLEVILDAVFNHTVEGDSLGPTLSLRGIDNAVYYRLDPSNPREYFNDTGCGHTLNVSHPHVTRFVLDCLRYWVEEMHVDGFRFDLAPILGRNEHGFDSCAAMFGAIADDAVLRDVKLIAEPWDVGPGGYQLGNFPAEWAEWNDAYRDDVRRFWRGDGGMAGALAGRLAGSCNAFHSKQRGPVASINAVACHDGFTLHDLVSYEHKHNDANAEQNRDGHNENLSRNFGREGSTVDPTIVDSRERAKRSFLATVAFSLGVPMITAGDEMGRTQNGNNNAYCQDNETTWVDWNLDERRRGLLAFTQRVFAVRAECRLWRRAEFFGGTAQCVCGLKDATWFRGDGQEMTDEDWGEHERRALALMIHGHEPGESSISGTVLLAVNASGDVQSLSLPVMTTAGEWISLVNTGEMMPGTVEIAPDEISLEPGTLQLLRFESNS